MGRFARLREIERLDPARDCQRIMHLSFGYEFCWDSTRALELALYRTYCVPSISGLLDRTGEFYRHTQRRYDDTAILIAEMCEWGYERGRGQEALARINWAHGHFKISNEDFLYVLPTFIYVPIHWIDRYGWRPTCPAGKLGYYHFWREVGTRMGIRNIPPTYEARGLGARLRAQDIPLPRGQPEDRRRDPRPVCVVVPAPAGSGRARDGPRIAR